MKLWLPALVVPVLTSMFPGMAAAQASPQTTWRPEVSAGVGIGHVFRWEDQTFGNEPNLSGAFAMLHRDGFGMEVEANHTFGLSPQAAPCGVSINGAPAACDGTGRNGVRSATMASVNARYEFRGQRVRPYVIAGLGVLQTTSVWSRATVDGSRVLVTEEELEDTGFGPELGAGLRVEVTRRMSITPEVRWLEAAWRSRLNLAVTRLSIRAAVTL